MSRSILRNLSARLASGVKRRTPPTPNKFRLKIELLEDRKVPSGSPSVAILGAPATPSWNNDVQSKLVSTGDFSSVTIIDVNTSTPTLAQLDNYASVLVYSDAGFQNPTTLGNNLAAYVNQGHGVVEQTFDFGGVSGDSLAGNWASGGYDPVTIGGYAYGTPLTLGTVEQPSSPVMTGVTQFSGGSNSYHDTGSLTANTTLIRVVLE